MRVTAILIQTERKRQDRSACHAEKRRRRARTRWLHCRIRTVPTACATAEAARGEKCLFSGQIRAKFTSDGSSLGECRLRLRHSWSCAKDFLNNFCTDAPPPVTRYTGLIAPALWSCCRIRPDGGANRSNASCTNGRIRDEPDQPSRVQGPRL